MANKKNLGQENYLKRCPVRREDIDWNVDENGMVVLSIENKGVFNKIAQKLLKKPRISYIHLDEIGSFVWPLLEENKDIISIGELVKEHFGEQAEPLYERLTKYFGILESYDFIRWQKM